jgi:alpha-beta hydrolase superfamily lysophospholipase
MKMSGVRSARTKNSLCGVLSVPKDAPAIVVMSHGFTSSKDSKIYCELQDMLNARGIGTLRYDYFGHGDRGEKFEDITLSAACGSLYSAMDFARQKGNRDIALLGASFGGLLSIIGAAVKPVKALVLKSPVTDPVSFWRGRLGDDGIQRWKEDGILHYDGCGEKYDLKSGFWENLNHYDMPLLIQRVSCHTLIVHGSADTVVPLEQSRKMAEMTGAELKVIEGADHAYSNPAHYEECKRAMVDFLAKQIKPQS